MCFPNTLDFVPSQITTIWKRDEEGWGERERMGGV